MRIDSGHAMASETDRTDVEQEQMTTSVINAAMASTEQTYEDFLACFTHLTAEDVTLPARGVLRQANQQPLPQVSGHAEHTGAAAMPKVIGGPTDTLEEVILDEGTKTQDILVRSKAMDSQHWIQVDNFLDAAASDDDSCSSLSETSDDNDICVTYEASFATKSVQTPDGDAPAATCVTPTTGTASGQGGKVHAIDHQDQSCIAVNDRERGLASKDALQWDHRPNPGEVEWDLVDLKADADLEGKTNIRQLDFSARQAMPTTENSMKDAACPEVSCDQVEPFQLDDEFDYDNVVLSSKYTAEEMDLLFQLRQTLAADSQVASEPKETVEETQRM